MTPRDGDVLLTGATGFVGMELLARYLEHSERRVVTLIRARDDAQAQERVHSVLVNMLGSDATRRYRGRVTALAGELTSERLGLGEARFNALADEVCTIVHSAASAIVLANQAFSRSGSHGSHPPSRLVRVSGVADG